MPGVVMILGTAPNLSEMPPLAGGIEVWMANDPKTYRKYIADITDHWTRWFNLHSRAHMEKTYPRGLNWYLAQDGTKPIYTQKYWSDIPGCVPFPRERIQAAFPEAAHYFTCSIAWLLAFAIVEGFEVIDLHGFALGLKPNDYHAYERPCFFYWVQQARNRGIVVTYPPDIHALPPIAGDPATYTGPLYGFATKPES